MSDNQEFQDFHSMILSENPKSSDFERLPCAYIIKSRLFRNHSICLYE